MKFKAFNVINMSEARDIEAVAYKSSEIIGTVKVWLMKQNETAKMVLVESVFKLWGYSFILQ